MKTIKYFLLLCSFALISACNQTTYASKDADSNAKEFTSDDGMATIYIVRDQPSFAHAATLIEMDGTYLGHTKPESFIVRKVSPGTYTIMVGTDDTPTVSIDAKANETYYVWQEMFKGPVFVESELHMIHADEGQRKVLASKLLAD